jgi:hypothetical protein
VAGGDEFIGGNGRQLGALLFIAAGTNALDVYSALNSSPWTAESFGGDPDKAKACKEYVYHSIAVTAFYGTVATFISRSLWPLVGTAIANVYMWWLYHRALARAAARESTSWDG